MYRFVRFFELADGVVGAAYLPRTDMQRRVIGPPVACQRARNSRLLHV